MKWYILCLVAGFFLASCDDDNGGGPSEAVTQAFNTKYPSATQVKWERQNNYQKADFMDNQLSNTAWFAENGQWYMTETELNDLTRLPEAVQTAFRNSEYSGWTTDDIDRVERLDAETIYVIEVKKANQEFDLCYTQDGVLIQVVPDDDNDDYESWLPQPDVLTQAMHDFIISRYPDARIIETEMEHGRIEADIVHDNRKKEVVFSVSDGQWINTHYDVRQSEVKKEVMAILNSSEYATFTIDDIEKYETPAEDYYLFELEKGNQEIDIKIDLNGNLEIVHT